MSSFPPNSPARGCAANFPPLRVRPQDVAEAQRLVDTVARVNNPRLGIGGGIAYRGAGNEFDVRHPVYRWNSTDFRDVFRYGFRARDQGDMPNETYYDLDAYVHNTGAPLLQDRAMPRGFVSTTLSNTWEPNPNRHFLTEGGTSQVYRYEIFAPGGIWVQVSLRALYQYRNQAEVSFVGAIAPQYIRSAQLFTVRHPPGSRFPEWSRETEIILNGRFNPHPTPRFVIYDALAYYVQNGRRLALSTRTYTPPESERERKAAAEYSYTHGPGTAAGTGREKEEKVPPYFPEEPAGSYTPEKTTEKVGDSSDRPDEWYQWYGHDVIDEPIYVTAAFRSESHNQAYLFMNNEYVMLDYAPRSKNDKILSGPSLICEGFPSLMGTPFAESGIDCAFDIDLPLHHNQAYIFCGNLCARIEYVPRTTDAKLITYIRPINATFRALGGTVFENGIDAGFKSCRKNEIYLFKGDQFAIMNYGDDTLSHSQTTIRDAFPCLAGTVFESGVDAAFASHTNNEAYLFKGEWYAHFNYSPGSRTTQYAYLVDGRVNPIRGYWYALGSILPRSNGRVDMDTHEHFPNQHHECDECDEMDFHDEL